MWIALFGLVLSGFLSATLLPGSSELVLVAFLLNYPQYWGVALFFVTLANTLGSATSYLLTRFIPHKKEINHKAVCFIRKYGAACLFFSFVPIVGDALPLAAGWLRLPFYRCLFFIALGKFVRYVFIIVSWWLVK